MRRRAPGPGPALPAPPTPAAVAALAATLTPDALDLTAGHALADFLVAAAKEKAGLVDPYVTDPDPLFKWIANDTLKIVELAPASNKVAAKRAFAGAEASYGLNREELKRTRWKTYAEFVVHQGLAERVRSARGSSPRCSSAFADQIRR